jgi:hypothetical protein
MGCATPLNANSSARRYTRLSRRALLFCASSAAGIVKAGSEVPELDIMLQIGTRLLREVDDADIQRSIAMEATSKMMARVATNMNRLEGSTTEVIEPDADFVKKLAHMGYSEAASKRSVIFTSNAGFGEALAWAVAHEDDVDFNQPVQQVKQADMLLAGGRVDQAKVLRVRAELEALLGEKLEGGSEGVAEGGTEGVTEGGGEGGDWDWDDGFDDDAFDKMEAKAVKDEMPLSPEGDALAAADALEERINAMLGETSAMKKSFSLLSSGGEEEEDEEEAEAVLEVGFDFEEEGGAGDEQEKKYVPTHACIDFEPRH